MVGQVAAAANGDIGVVLLHGKAGTPSGHVRELGEALVSKGYLVSIPAMPWSEDRIYDASFEDSMKDIDREVDSLRQKGAKLVIVAGHSLGANAALGYAARREIGGIVMLAPAHTPELGGFRSRVAGDVGRAKDLVAAGRGKEQQRFLDINQGEPLPVTATPEAYLSWLDPDGPAVMPRSAASFEAPTPLLVVVGSGEPNAQGSYYFFDKAPPHPKSKFVSVSADHSGLPAAAIEEVASWLAACTREYAAS